MRNNAYERRIAYLEFVNDQLESEIRYVDHLLKTIGFPDGLETIKDVVQETMEEEPPEPTQ
jgi:hypothetical protein